MKNSWARIILFSFLVIFPFSPLLAQCTDADEDAYYYEEGCGSPRDCNDANAEIYPGAEEICNGYDDNCDGGLDEVCNTACDDPEKSGWDVRVTNHPDHSSNPTLVWNGNEYAIAWNDQRDGNREIYFARLDSSGNKIGSDVRVTHDSAISHFPSLVWTGSELGVSWCDWRDGNGEIYFVRLDSSGNKIGSDVRVTNDFRYSDHPSLLWNGSEFAISWHDNRNGYPNYEIYLARLDSSGNKIGSDLRVTYDDSESSYPSLIWTGSKYGIAWADNRDTRSSGSEIYFARLDSSGNKIGTDVRVTYVSARSVAANLVWNGSEYAISWCDDRHIGNYYYEIYFARLDSFGNKIGADIRVTHNSSKSATPSLIWSGSEYGVSWHDQRDGNKEIYFARLDSSGNKIGTDLRVTYDAAYSNLLFNILAWNGSEYGVTWYDLRDGNEEIYFARIECAESPSNQPPIANAGEDSQSECTSPEGTLVTFDGSASTDPDSTPGTNDDIMSFEWFEYFDSPSEIYLGEGEILDVTLSLGSHTITLLVTDSFGETDTDEVVKTVVDTTPPNISVSVDPDTLWPPNHRMVNAEADVTASDTCGVPTVILESIASSEPDDSPGGGDGNTVDDIQDADIGTADFNFKLRAERMGIGTGRTYTITYQATDPSGNDASASDHANVPHDKNGKTEPVDLSLRESMEGTLVEWSEVTEALHYNVIRGVLGNIRETGKAIDLGDVLCIDDNSLDTSTEGNEDYEMPELGEVFFYLVEYDDGSKSSYGTESTSKPREVKFGDCP